MKFYAATVLCLLATAAYGELLSLDKPLESMPNRRTYAFKNTPQGELKVDVYPPPGWQAGQKHPAILMFFGGGFTGGTPVQFRSKAEYLASRGMVALTPEYRTKTKHQTTPRESIEDCKSAVRWARLNASALGIDTGRIAASGGSSGGTCAALTALNTSYEPVGEDMSVSSKPNALVLYNPALAVSPAAVVAQGEGLAPSVEVLTAWKLSKNSPSMILFFGTKDKLLEGSREVARQSAAMGNRAELYTAPGVGHGFFNDATTAKNGVAGWHEVVLYQTDLFLSSLGYLSGKPAVKPSSALTLTREPL